MSRWGRKDVKWISKMEFAGMMQQKIDNGYGTGKACPAVADLHCDKHLVNNQYLVLM